MSKKKIVFVGVILELLLIFSYLIWREMREGEPSFGDFTAWNALLGIVVALLIFIGNVAFTKRILSADTGQALRFLREVVEPIIAKLGWFSAAVLSVLAGFGEEMFFRGVLQYEMGWFFSSVLFSLMHFGGAVVEFPKVAILYFFASLVFALLLIISGSLWPPILAHAVYDFLAIMYLKTRLHE